VSTKGADIIARLTQAARGRIAIMAGGGVDPHDAPTLSNAPVSVRFMWD